MAKRASGTRKPSKRAAPRPGARATRSGATGGGDHLAEIRLGEQFVDQVQHAQNHFRAAGRQAMGVPGKGSVASLRESVARSGVGWYPLVALGLLSAVVGLQRYGLLVLAGDMGRARGISSTAFGLVTALQILVIGLAGFPMAAGAHSRMVRLAVTSGFVWSVAVILVAFATGIGFLILIVLGAAAASSVYALHLPLLMDSYAPEARVRAFAFHHGAASAGYVLAAMIVGGLTQKHDFTWRAVWAVFGLVSLAAAAASVRVREPESGQWDTARVREAVDRETDFRAEDGGEIHPDFFEVVRRLLLIPSVRWLLTANAFLGMMLFPLYGSLFMFLEQRWRMGPGARGVFFAAMAAFSIAALAAFGRRGDGAFRAHPSKLLRVGGVCLAIGAAALGFAPFFPWLWGVYLLYGIAFGIVSLLHPILNVSLLSIVQPSMRPHASALAGVSLIVLGSLGGLSLISSLGGRFGIDIGLASLALPALQGALLLIQKASPSIDYDLDRTVDEVVEREFVRSLIAHGRHLPMLACRRINFSYGQLQVLFDVDFTVDDGEMVALLGTNGAGKSTLLRIISGLGVPSSGSIRFRGGDITYLDAERRLRLGITQVPGGRAVFGPLTVVENLRVFGYAHGRSRRTVEQGIEESFKAFPGLVQRRNQLASTLSGGEQQMLGLARALILKPRLLLIDELSLGLAPKIVSELLEMVREINREGVAVVLVEQSVNIALLLAEHAYFMEKGDIRFDGRAHELLARMDLLRSVFLEGATKGFAR